MRKQSAPAAVDGPPKPKQSKSRNGVYYSIHPDGYDMASSCARDRA